VLSIPFGISIVAAAAVVWTNCLRFAGRRLREAVARRRRNRSAAAL